GAEVDAGEIARSDFGQFVGELDGRLGGERLGGCVRELARLLRHGATDLLATVPGIYDPEAGDAVQVFLAVHVPDGGVLATGEDLEPLLLRNFGPGLRVDPDVLQGFLLDCLGRHGRRLLFGLDAHGHPPQRCWITADSLRDATNGLVGLWPEYNSD